jgi:hypothetical protein
MPYERTQHALWMWIIPISIIVLILVAWSTDPRLAMVVPVLVAIVPVLFVSAIFTRLTIRVDAGLVRWHFGWGWPAGRIPVAEIANEQITHTSLLEGFGIHWTIWHGWLWNASGFQAVEISKTNGGRVTLGTDDPQGLTEAIERFRRGAA